MNLIIWVAQRILGLAVMVFMFLWIFFLGRQTVVREPPLRPVKSLASAVYPNPHGLMEMYRPHEFNQLSTSSNGRYAISIGPMPAILKIESNDPNVPKIKPCFWLPSAYSGCAIGNDGRTIALKSKSLNTSLGGRIEVRDITSLDPIMSVDFTGTASSTIVVDSDRDRVIVFNNAWNFLALDYRASKQIANVELSQLASSFHVFANALRQASGESAQIAHHNGDRPPVSLRSFSLISPVELLECGYSVVLHHNLTKKSVFLAVDIGSTGEVIIRKSIALLKPIHKAVLTEVDGDVLIGCVGDDVSVWRSSSGQYQSLLDAGREWSSVGISRSGKLLAFALSGRNDRSVRVIRTDNGKEVALFDGFWDVNSLRLMFLGDNLLVVRETNGLSVWKISKD